MKYLAIILSVYFVALNFVPCGDIDFTNHETGNVSIESFDANHDHACEFCSPFCNCHCCHTHVINEQHFWYEIDYVVISKKVSSREQGFLQDVSFRFFQPPKIVG
ncbi:DUF6660 family protein [Aquimarina latercula]|uniref:DUF6660 family protein n=1 Tax=Aquimarina latercula TaxID=987 RepID=UPI0012DED13A|nr:DUF6660 family protein [Aquimarina latercula]